MALTIRLDKQDNVVTALRTLAPGEQGAAERIPRGHKMAVQAIQKGGEVTKYAQLIGYASQPIVPGAHVHTHNLAFRNIVRGYEKGSRSALAREAARGDSFMGFRRDDGGVGVRNYIAVDFFGELFGDSRPACRRVF